MENPPRPGADPSSPTEPIARVRTSESDTTVVNVPPPEPGDGRPPNMPWYTLVLMAAVITLAIYWWFSQMQQEAQIQINATVTAATDATATADAAATAASVAQATATASQALAQSTAAAQATAAAQGVAAVNATLAAQTAAAEQARATSEAIAAQANAAAEATRTAPTPTPAATATPVVVVVTATAPPPTAPPQPVSTLPSLPSSGQAGQATEGSGQAVAETPTVVQTVPPTSPPAPASSPASGAPSQPAPSPGAVPAASPVASPVGAARVSSAPGQPTLIQCLDEQVQVIAEPGALPPQTMLTCRPVEPGTVPPPPGELVGETIFRVDASAGNDGALPGSVTLQVAYPPDAEPAAERGRLILGYLDGTEWQPLPEQDAETADARVTAPADRTGVYALYRQP